MRRLYTARPWRASLLCQCRRVSYSATSSPPLIQITNATFYRDYPTEELPQKDNLPIFPNLSFALPSTAPSSKELQHWAIIGSSGKAKFLNVLNGQYICIPPTARSYPYLATDEIERKDHRLRFPGFAIKYVGFNADASRSGSAGAVRGAYLSARYESRREETDFTVLQYLKGQTELNPLDEGSNVNQAVLGRVIHDLKLDALLDMPVANLSNGQTRRARIAKALLDGPEVLLLDEPFMGLDPPTVQGLSPLLHNLAVKSAPRLIMTLRPQDPVPEWISHLVVLGDGNTVALQGERSEVLRNLDIWKAVSIRRTIYTPESLEGQLAGGGKLTLWPRSPAEDAFYRSLSTKEQDIYNRAEKLRTDGLFETNAGILNDFGLIRREAAESGATKKLSSYGEPIIEMDGVKVSYGDIVVLGDWNQIVDGQLKPGLHWKVHRGQRWGVFGLNGSGKTTLISLITSDHPQAYALPIKLFGRSRLPEPGKPGISIFDLQKRIGHSSPEIHGFFPRTLSVRAVVESAWAETFLAKPKLDHQRRQDVDSALRFFEAELNPSFVPWSERSRSPEKTNTNWSTSVLFTHLTVAQQRLLLFLRAVVHKPDLIILDEPFAGMSPSLRDKCLHFLEVGERTTASSGSRKVSGRDLWHLPPDDPAFGIRHTGLSEEQSLIVISHVKEEVPDVVSHWMALPGASQRVEGGELKLRVGNIGEGQRVASKEIWERIWNMA
ncbi:ABC transporter [Coccidioides immitis RS]|uniref:ABC transporter n=1 Tax=Coccidioides immitis (strain RS) TaxID=246410 RepID=A0A0E1RW83_COCIM|nr:ABC transporter [Coccidioides immitis RS]EAS28593.2 ABC transporter [Coccidioides immitis RS]